MTGPAPTLCEPLPAPALRLARRPGRLRWLRHVALLPLLVGGAGFWLGMAGAAPMLVWWWLWRPRPAGGAHWEVAPGAVRGYRFGRWRTVLDVGSPGAARRRLELFHDEVGAADLARLRRLVKAAGAGRWTERRPAGQLAAGCSTSSRSENPGNRMVSSDRGRVSGWSRL